MVGRDPTTDLAVVRVAASGLAPAAFPELAPRAGQLALAVTRPGRNPKASLGLVSRVGDAFHTPLGGRLDRYVELDVALHRGFSGGLALDLSGRALGLVTVGLAGGAALAVPAATLQRVVKALLAHGAIRRGYLGVATFPVRLPARAGRAGNALLVTAVEDGSPAERAGLLVGDILLALDGAPLAHAGDLLPLLEEERIGAAAAARVWRAGELREVAVTIGARGAEARP